MAIAKGFSITVHEYHDLMKATIILLREISELKKDESKELQLKAKTEELSAIYSALSNPELVCQIQTRLKKIQKKRESQRRRKSLRSASKKKAEQHRTEQHEKIDQWLNSIIKKNLQIKKENEIKTEADNILSEVKKKISEARHNLDRLIALEKLRNARKANSLAKGLFVPSKYETQFVEKVSLLKVTMQKQLRVYEDEERALSVMLGTEQEGQREKEKNRKIKKLKEFQEEKQANIVQCLFGTLDVPSPSDPKYLYWNYYTSAANNVESLLKIRCSWDSYLVPPSCEEGSTIPQQWVVPDVPSSTVWATTLQTFKSQKSVHF